MHDGEKGPIPGESPSSRQKRRPRAAEEAPGSFSPRGNVQSDGGDVGGQRLSPGGSVRAWDRPMHTARSLDDTAQARGLNSANEDAAAWRQSRGAALGYPSRLARRRRAWPITQPPGGYTAFGRWAGAAPLGGPAAGLPHGGGPFPGFWAAEGRNPSDPPGVGRRRGRVVCWPGPWARGRRGGGGAGRSSLRRSHGGRGGGGEGTRNPQQRARQGPKAREKKKGGRRKARRAPALLCALDASYGKTPSLQASMHGKGELPGIDAPQEKIGRPAVPPIPQGPRGSTTDAVGRIDISSSAS